MTTLMTTLMTTPSPRPLHPRVDGLYVHLALEGGRRDALFPLAQPRDVAHRPQALRVFHAEQPVAHVRGDEPGLGAVQENREH